MLKTQATVRETLIMTLRMLTLRLAAAPFLVGLAFGTVPATPASADGFTYQPTRHYQRYHYPRYEMVRRVHHVRRIQRDVCDYGNCDDNIDVVAPQPAPQPVYYPVMQPAPAPAYYQSGYSNGCGGCGTVAVAPQPQYYYGGSCGGCGTAAVAPQPTFYYGGCGGCGTVGPVIQPQYYATSCGGCGGAYSGGVYTYNGGMYNGGYNGGMYNGGYNGGMYNGGAYDAYGRGVHLRPRSINHSQCSFVNGRWLCRGLIVP